MPGRRFVYGPVASRRLGFSLGVDIIPFKTCTLDCGYCQLGSTGRTTVRRGRWFPPEEILAQIKEALDSGQIVVDREDEPDYLHGQTVLPMLPNV